MNMSHTIHALPDSVTVCDRHPGAKTFTDGGIRICLATFQESVKPADASQTAPAAAEEKPQKKEGEEKEVPFKTPQEILDEKAAKLRRERAYYMRNWEDSLAMGIQKMVTEGKTECTLACFMTRLMRDEYAEIAKKLRASGYLVTFVDKKTGVSILDSLGPFPQSAASTGPRCQCGCSSEVGGVLREMAHIRDAVTAWASSFLVQEKTHNWDKDEILIEARISIAPSACEQQQAKGGEEHVPLFSVPQQQQNAIPVTSEDGRGPVMQLLMTTPITHILLAFFILPLFLPRFLVGIWQLFMGFILVSRFLRWNSRPVPVRRGHVNERCSSAQTGSGFIPGVYAAQGC
jgi:hypothetical protein